MQVRAAQVHHHRAAKLTVPQLRLPQGAAYRLVDFYALEPCALEITEHDPLDRGVPPSGAPGEAALDHAELDPLNRATGEVRAQQARHTALVRLEGPQAGQPLALEDQAILAELALLHSSRRTQAQRPLGVEETRQAPEEEGELAHRFTSLRPTR